MLVESTFLTAKFFALANEVCDDPGIEAVNRLRTLLDQNDVDEMVHRIDQRFLYFRRGGSTKDALQPTHYSCRDRL
jgi:hypothetical protein